MNARPSTSTVFRRPVAGDGRSADRAGRSLGVVVYGMGRSGTSALAGLFARSGFYVGERADLMQPNSANPAGFNENLKILEVNEAILHDLDATWFDPPSEAAQMAVLGRWGPRARAVVTELLLAGHGAPIVVKDPRIEVLLPIWGDVLRGRLHPVIAIRDPIEIALSLAVRDGTPVAFGIAAWEVHMTTLLRHLEGELVTVAPYRTLMSSTDGARSVVTAAVAHLRPEGRESVAPSDGTGWLRPDLHRNHVSGRDHAGYLTGHQQRLWEWLDALSPGDHHLRPPRELTEPSELARLGTAAERERARVAAEAEQRGAQLEAELQQAVQARDAEHREVLALRGAHTELTRAHAELGRSHSVVVHSRSWRATATARRLAHRARRLHRAVRRRG